MNRINLNSRIDFQISLPYETRECSLIFRGWRTKRQLRNFVQSADPQLLAEERAALARENAEAPDLRHSPLTPTEIGTEIFPTSRRFLVGLFQTGIPALKPTDSSFKVRGLIEPEGIDQPKD